MKDFVASLRLVVSSMAVCCVLYPAALLLFANAVVPDLARGSLVEDSAGRIVGSRKIAQGFTRPEYFWPRPSAVDYAGSGAGGSNLSPANPAIAERARGLIERHGLAEGERIPAELVTASGSGLDPHITVAAARFQLPRVAAARGRAASEIESLIDENTEVPTLRIFGGEPVVNVLLLNRALDGHGE